MCLRSLLFHPRKSEFPLKHNEKLLSLSHEIYGIEFDSFAFSFVSIHVSFVTVLSQKAQNEKFSFFQTTKHKWNCQRNERNETFLLLFFGYD